MHMRHVAKASSTRAYVPSIVDRTALPAVCGGLSPHVWALVLLHMHGHCLAEEILRSAARLKL